MKSFRLNGAMGFAGQGPLNRAGFLLLLLVLVFLFQAGISPMNKIREFQKLAGDENIPAGHYSPVYEEPGLKRLVRERSFNEALLGLSAMDSIQLGVNLSDSVAALFVKGVKIHQAAISSYKIDPLLSRIPQNQYVRLFSQPLEAKAQNATTVKEPVVVRQAPRDTIEAALNAWEPDTLIQRPAFLQMELEYGIDLILEQENNPGFRDHWTRFGFRNGICTRAFLHDLMNFITLKKQEYTPAIVIKIPADDLRAIYRALPLEAYVAIYYQ